MKIAVTGSRDATDAEFVYTVMDTIKAEYQVTHVVEGGADGVDSLVSEWCKDRRVTRSTYWADWDKYKKYGGPERNGRMLKDAKPLILFAFPGGKGTANCVNQALEMGIEVIYVEPLAPWEEMGN